jgi:VIT1/CCC1 family predicted Fe2+/Mn2+ transporter
MAKEGFLRNFIFGVNDALVSTVGFVSGIAVVAVGGETIVLVGMVLIFVEAFAMGVGSFLSDETVRETRRRGRVASWPSLFGALVMFASYLIAGLLVLAPYALTTTATAFWWSIALSLSALFAVGAYSERNAGLPWFYGGVRMMVFGGAAVALGVLVGKLIG